MKRPGAARGEEREGGRSQGRVQRKEKEGEAGSRRGLGRAAKSGGGLRRQGGGKRGGMRESERGRGLACAVTGVGCGERCGVQSEAKVLRCRWLSALEGKR